MLICSVGLHPAWAVVLMALLGWSLHGGVCRVYGCCYGDLIGGPVDGGSKDMIEDVWEVESTRG